MSAIRRPLCFGTNLKMHQTPEETTAFVGGVRAAVGDALGRDDVHLFVIPPFTSLPAAVEAARGSGLWIGAQNVHPAADGAFTGEISTRMLQAVGVDLVLIGHAERRGLFGETDAFVNEKVRAALAAGFRVLVCVGETAAEKGYGVGPETVVRQLKIALHGVEADAIDRLMVGYEPVWSIGAGGTPARPDDVALTAGHLRAALRSLYPAQGDAVPILYGGSVDPSNVAGFVALDDIDGAFVGRAAWTVDGYAAVLRAALDHQPDHLRRRIVDVDQLLEPAGEVDLGAPFAGRDVAPAAVGVEGDDQAGGAAAHGTRSRDAAGRSGAGGSGGRTSSQKLHGTLVEADHRPDGIGRARHTGPRRPPSARRTRRSVRRCTTPGVARA